MRALVVERSAVRFAAARVVSAVPGNGWGNGAGRRLGPLALIEREAPEPPSPEWLRLRPLLSGICGSDLATLDARSSRWFEDIVSFPFVPGHEVVAETENGRRVVVNPLLSCITRGIDPPCLDCASGRPNRCRNLTGGHLPPGLQIGYCAGTGGGWSGGLVAHSSSCFEVPAGLSDEAAVLVEPAASALHGALAAARSDRQMTVVVIGAGMQGLVTVAALARWRPDAVTVIAIAKHADQQRLAREFGATVVAEPAEIRRAVRRRCGGTIGDHGQLSGGAEVVIDCVGSASSLSDALSVTAPGGTILLTGMPAPERVDLTPLWHREVTLRGSYAYGTEAADGRAAARHSFELAFELVGEAGLERLLSATYPLDHYTQAVSHAANAGKRGAVKVAFDLRREKRR